MKIRLIIAFAIFLSIMSCENQENPAADFGSTSVYFPYQRPARTLVLGKYELGFNENDNNGRFEIGVVMSGVVENSIDRTVYFELAPELIDANALGVDSVNVQILPSSYYTIEQQSPVTIPAGSINGRIPVQLNDAFFDDPLSFADKNQTHYVIPLRITNYERLDSLLTGVPIVTDPIKILDSHWNPTPKDYTLFGIKFMNKYQGIYLRRGADHIVGTSEKTTFETGETETMSIDTTSVYSAEFVVDDETTEVLTSGRNSVTTTNRVRRGNLTSDDTVALQLTVDANGDITITSVEGDEFNVTGSGKWVENGDEWGGQKRDVMYLEYEYSDFEIIQEEVDNVVISETTNDLIHKVNDTLVIRNRDVVFEEFVVELIKE